MSSNDSNTTVPPALVAAAVAVTKQEEKKTKFQLLEEVTGNAGEEALINTIEFQDFLVAEGIAESVTSVLGIVNKYTNSSSVITLADVNEDILVLAAQLVYISCKTGELQGTSVHADNLKNLYRSRKIIQVKGAAEERNLKLTDAEADHFSRSVSASAYNQIAIIEIACKYLNGLMFSAKFFCEMLDSVAKRLVHESKM